MTPCLICRGAIDDMASDAHLLTCSAACHERFLSLMIQTFGEFKVVVGPDAIPRLVPTRDIVEKGIKASDLDRYPKAGFG